jgi:hypothetical protein
MAFPALAADIVSSHEVRSDQVTFVCGEKNDFGKGVRFMHATRGAKYISLFLVVLFFSSAGQAQQLGNGERYQTYPYYKEIFICGETPEKDGKRRRLIGEPYEPRIPMLEPKKDDPIWKSWDLIFKIICKNFYQQPNIDVALGNLRSVR